MPSLRATVGGALVSMVLAGCVVKEESPPQPVPFHCDTDGTVPRVMDGGFHCVAPESLPLSVQEARSALMAADAGTAGDAGTASRAGTVSTLAPSVQLHLGTSADAGEALVVEDGFHVQGFPVIGRVATYALNASVSTSSSNGPVVLAIPLDRLDAGTYRYRASATIGSNQPFPTYVRCELLVKASQGSTADPYVFAVAEDQPANAYLEGQMPGDASQLLVVLNQKGALGGSSGATCTIKSLTATLEVFR